MGGDTPPTLRWSAQLREAHWRCEVSEDGDIWYARLFRNGELAAWYRASAPEPAVKWADALAAVFASETPHH